jgi:hypothetical protein
MIFVTIYNSKVHTLCTKIAECTVRLYNVNSGTAIYTNFDYYILPCGLFRDAVSICIIKRRMEG